MTVSPIRAIAEVAESTTIQPAAPSPGLLTTESGQVVGWMGSITQLAGCAGIPTQHLPVGGAGRGLAKADDRSS